MPRAMPVMSSALASSNSGAEQLLDVRLQPQIEPRLHRFARRAGQPFVGNDAHARMQRVVGRHQLGHRVAGPADGAVRGQHELIVGRGGEFFGARVDLAGQRLLRGRLQRLGVRAGFRRIGREGESVEPADHMALYDHFAGLADFRIQHRVFPQAAHQYTGTAVNETLREPFMQRIGQFIFDLARNPLPVIGIGQPVRAVGDERPGADLRDPARQRVDIAVGAVGLVDLGGKPGVRNPALFHQEAEQRRHQFGMRGRRDLAVIRNLAGVPQPLHRRRAMRHVAHLGVARGVIEHAQVFGDRRAGQRLVRRRQRQRHLQRAERGEIQLRIAPLQHLDAVEGVVLQRVHQFRLERRAAAGGAEGAVAGGAAGAAGDLREFGRIEPAELIAVIFAVGGEGDVIDVEIEPHADRVGGDEIIDVAVLEHRDLRVAGARRQRAQHHRRAAMLAADQFGDRIDLVGRERDDRGAPRLPRDLAVAGEFELRQPRPRDDGGARQQPLDDRPHGRRAQQQRLVAAAPVQDAIGEDVPALEIGRDLDFIDGEKRHVEIARHRLHGGDPEARLRRLDLLLAGDQRDGVGARASGDLVVDLARQQPQRQADHAGGMRQHPLDRQMGLAGVGRPEHRGDAGSGSPPLARMDGEDEKAMFSEVVSASLRWARMPRKCVAVLEVKVRAGFWKCFTMRRFAGRG